MRIMQRSLYVGSLAILTVALSGCGQKKSNSSLFGIEVGVNAQGEAVSLVGTQANSFKIDVTGCESGYSALNLATNPIYLYSFDTNCIATLKEFTVGSVTYTGTLTGPVGTKSRFTGGGKSLSVAVSSQLSSPLISSDKISFNFSEINKGNDNLPAGSSYSEGHGVEISGVEAPNMQIFSANTVSMAKGVASFKIQFECQSPVTSAKQCASLSGVLQDMTKMDAVLVEDTFTNVLTLEQAEALFVTGSTFTTALNVNEGTPPVPNGGISAVLVGPGKLYEKRNLMVVVRYQTLGAASYQYFNLDIGEPGP